MAAATITTSEPGPALKCENVILTVTDGETYTSRMSSPLFGQLTFLEAVTLTSASPAQSIPSIGISGRTVTIAATGVTDKLACLSLWGMF